LTHSLASSREEKIFIFSFGHKIPGARSVILNPAVNHESASRFALKAINLVGELQKIGRSQNQILHLRRSTISAKSG
jgi:hypothetical protein